MGVPSTVNGMLGGYEHISQIDAKGTVGFLSHLPRNITVADCGAGIGRVTQTALLKLFKSIDLVEQSSQFLETAKTLLKDVNGISYICTGLQEFMPAQNRYGLIWIQWVAGHLPDDDLVSFLIRCKQSLAAGTLNLTFKVDLSASRKMLLKRLEYGTKKMRAAQETTMSTWMYLAGLE